jgi:hypothetical protein
LPTLHAAFTEMWISPERCAALAGKGLVATMSGGSRELPPFCSASPLPAFLKAGDVPFADPDLAAQAGAWKRKRCGLSAAIEEGLQAAQAGPLTADSRRELVALQMDNLRCLQALNGYHLAQMHQHMAMVAGLRHEAVKAQARAVGAALTAGADVDLPQAMSL